MEGERGARGLQRPEQDFGVGFEVGGGEEHCDLPVLNLGLSFWSRAKWLYIKH